MNKQLVELLDEKHRSYNLFNHPFSQEIWKARYKAEQDANIIGTFGRTATAIAQPENCAFDYWREQFFTIMSLGLFMPAGRILASAGLDTQSTLQNCFAGDQKFFTKEMGTISLKEAANRSGFQVLTLRGWKPASVRSFGIQQLQKVRFKSNIASHLEYVVRVTAEHRWILPDLSETTNLKVGNWIYSHTAATTRNNDHYNAGFKHGVIYGDRHLRSQTKREISGGYPLGTYHYDVRLCGAKKQYLPYFPGDVVHYQPSAKGDPIVYVKSLMNFKEPPETTCSGDYIAGFIDGWHAADGHFENGGTQKVIAGCKKDGIDWLVDNAALGGYLVTGRELLRKAGHKTNLGTLKNNMEGITFKDAKTTCWQVVSIEPDIAEEVFCAVVPGEASFTLAGGLYTGNCYVGGTMIDSTEGIMQSYGEAMITLGRFGGIGTDFTPIRPKGAKIGSQGLKSPGVILWMHMWHEGADRIKQAGHRRGAMMGTIADHHPDILDFIEAKHTAGALTNFNVSILISDKFMNAVKGDKDWHLWHERARDQNQGAHNLEPGKAVYIYQTVSARELWEKIMQSTYEFAEPGVIFIDKYNAMNNLWYCEEIRCTNPCGEQGLPPYGACNLGHINLARMVNKPFARHSEVNWRLLKETVRIAIRFLDNVIDVSNFPLDQQKQEQMDKRRIGLGVSGLGDMLIQLGIKYGSREAINVTDEVMRCIAVHAYETSIDLGKKKGSFPLFDPHKYGARSFAYRIKKVMPDCNPSYNHMRNSLLLSIAPCGTTSIVFGNISSGIEPNFAFRMNRKVWVENNKYEEHVNESFISLFYNHCEPNPIPSPPLDLLPYAVKAMDIAPADHVLMQAAVQHWIDASVTKTVNCPKDIPFEEFKTVYMQAYDNGCKGCTTYRQSEVRGAVLEDADAKPEILLTPEADKLPEERVLGTPDPVPSPDQSSESAILPVAKRPQVLGGHTYKIKWPHHNDNIYLTINEDAQGKPYEIFIASMDLRNIEWMVLGCILASQSLRHGEDPLGLTAIFQKIQGASEGAWIDKKYYTSLPALIGKVLEDHFTRSVRHKMSGDGMGARSQTAAEASTLASMDFADAEARIMAVYQEGKRCVNCGAPAIIKSEGCEKCLNCGYDKCG